MKKILLLVILTALYFGSFAQTILADTTLHGTLVSKAPDATSVTYLWTQVSGPTATIVSPTSLITEVKGNAYGVYTFQLVGTDNLGSKSLPSQVTMTVVSGILPVVSAGSNFSIKIGSSQ